MRRSILHAAVLILAVLAVAGCGESPTAAPDAPGVPGLPGAQPDRGSAFLVLVSNPVGPRPAGAGAAGRVGGLAADLSSVDVPVYVSIEPGTVPHGIMATIVNGRTGTSVDAVMVDDGFDPAPIPAEVGDTLTVSVVRTTGGVLMAKSVVPATRPPRVVRTSPPRGRTDVAINATIAVIFSEPMDLSTVTTGTMRLLKDGTLVPGVIRPLAGSIAGVEFVPARPLASATAYELVLDGGIADQAGDRLVDPGTTDFRTAGDGVVTSPDQLTFTVQPSSVVSNATIGPVVVTVRDSLGAVDSTYSDAITIRLGNNVGGANLRGQTTVSAVAGVARMDYLLVDAIGSGYTLVATAGSRSGTSAGFTVTPSPWTLVAPPPPNYRIWGAATAINGLIYVIGGEENHWDFCPCTYLSAVDVYDPATDRWTARAPLPTPRTGLALGVVDGIIYAVGGRTDESPALTTVEAFDPATNTWTARAPMLSARSFFEIGVVNGKLFAVDGNGTGSVEVYDPAANSWSNRTFVPTPRYNASIAVVGGSIYVVGGLVSGVTAFDPQVIDAYDPPTNTWTIRAAPPRVAEHPWVGMVNDRLYLVGGNRSLGAFDAAYDPATDRWTPVPPLPGGTMKFAGASVSGVIYAFELGQTYAYRP